VADIAVRLRDALSDRYTIERELGRGGMATVYLARDLKHDRLVALKVLHPHLATAVGPQRFLREIMTTAQLSHPHILAVFDSGRTERSGGGPANGGIEEFLWYAMPYVEGESLREKLIRERQLALKDALRITREVASALDYAHGRGIVHRDIKPENIMLTRQGEALVADFGIARALATAATGSSTLTEAGVALGTAQYMSPEQVDGTPEVDGRADVYALGCVLYEMLAGEPPYTGASVLAVIAKRLVDPVPSIRRLREAIPPHIDAAIRSALATAPADRYPTAGGFAGALDRTEAAAGDGTVALPAVRPRTSRRFWRLAALAAGVAVAVGLSSRLISPGRPNVERVAVFPFANRTGDASFDALGSLSADWIAQAVSRVPGVELVTMPSLMVDPSIAEAVRTSRDSLGKAAGAHRMIWGSIYRTGDSVRLVANLTDVTRGSLLASIEASAAATTPESAVQLLAERVSTGVLARQSRDTVEMLMRSTRRPPTFAAFQAFAEGMTVWETEGEGKAAALFERAVALDSTFLSPLVWAGFIYRNEGEYAHADSIGSIAERQRERLGPFERAALERMLAEVRGDNEGALAASRQVLSAAPTSDWAKCVTAEAALWVNRPRYALRILDGLETRPGIYNGGAWCDFVPFEAWLMLDDAPRALAAARRFGRKWTQGELGVGTELYLEATALARLGRTAEARALVDSAAILNPHACLCLFVVGHELRNAGDPAAARAVFERAATMARGSRDTADLARAGEALYWAGRWDEASAIFQQLIGHAKYAVRAHGALGVLAARRENPQEAKAADAWLAGLDPRHRRGEVSVWRARIAAALGERGQAVALLEQAFAQGQTQDYFGLYGPGMAWFRQDPHFDSLRDFPAYVALLRPKG
jgi:tetratricopeptide (TPR) repeat protein/TolB-like protein